MVRQLTIHVITSFQLLPLNNIRPQKAGYLLRTLNSFLSGSIGRVQRRLLLEFVADLLLSGSQDWGIACRVSAHHMELRGARSIFCGRHTLEGNAGCAHQISISYQSHGYGCERYAAVNVNSIRMVWKHMKQLRWKQ